ncbi:UdgX family uracil-DNA binding protein [Protofrankia symbiont of Coriaria ruscifolia]|uniref:Type-4 uracil-DNA glycosylase n=1 Tax=Candidatus Protofrankia californiensis TaxID=1839754 RepID=A0A1C3NT90_9ACTN|nr:UdgX family uracil-DNA binding protein [Protofrankia symbiont of Coriaria ruscifolia]SBW17610.1 phage SPO1 DNA polymerase-like protein [Candidatus Protofrankia californiensis]
MTDSSPAGTGTGTRSGSGAAPFVPPGADLAGLAAAAASCRGCDLADLPDTRTVFGEGNPHARLVLVGEQPGDIEDQRGRPFVGPAGKLLDRALADAGIDRAEAYVTNAVKHFRYRRSDGPRRIHQTPDARQITACRPWLAAELNRIRPLVVVLLGATAGQALLGPSFRVTKMRGRLLPGPPGSEAQLIATLHPSAVLRVDPVTRDEVYAGFVRDLQLAERTLAGMST